MSEPAELASDRFMQLLTDALRSGPGSPQWHQAMQTLRAHGASDAGAGAGRADAQAHEYALLCRVREYLESGKDYRSIRPGPRFTQKVLQAIDQEAAKHASGRRPRTPTATLVAIFAAIAILAVAGILAYLLLPGDSTRVTIETLSNTYWTNVPGSVVFDGPVPPEWRKIGSLSLSGSRGLQPDGPGGAGTTYTGGGLLLQIPIPANQSAAMEVSLRLSKLSDNQVVQAFVTDQREFDPTTALSPHELVWLVQDGQAKVVLPDQRSAVQNQHIRESRQLFTVRIMIAGNAAVVDSNGLRLWSGAHQLSPTGMRYLGVRFLQRGPERPDAVVIRSIKIQSPQK